MTATHRGLSGPGVVTPERTPADGGAFPWMLAINGSTPCTGIRLADQLIVTVQHCGHVIGAYAGARAPFQPLLLDPRVARQPHASLDFQRVRLSTNLAHQAAPPFLTDAQLEACADRPLRAIGFGRAGLDRQLSYGEVRLVTARCHGASIARYESNAAEFVTTNLVKGSLLPGDSGGAILATDGSRWYLAGMILRLHGATNHVVHLRMPLP